MVSGQIAQDERGELAGPGDPAEQAQQVFENLRRRLAAAGADFGEVVKLGAVAVCSRCWPSCDAGDAEVPRLVHLVRREGRWPGSIPGCPHMTGHPG